MYYVFSESDKMSSVAGSSGRSSTVRKTKVGSDIRTASVIAHPVGRRGMGGCLKLC